MEKRERIRQLMPIVDQIKDDKLRNGVLDTWVRAWNESEWEDVADCIFSLELEVQECSLMQHTNFVATVALAMGCCGRDTWHIPVDTDLLLAGALLHDVCKVVEDAPQEGSKLGKKSAIGENLQHGMYGVHLALDAKMPLEVVHIISSHTPRVTQIPKSIEGVYVCYADYAAADSLHLVKGTPLMLKS
ncbi:HDIG domain-containing metalloprotein [Chloroflexota bacterium]